MDQIELKECPFCGAKNDPSAIREVLRYDGSLHAVVCMFCGAQGPTGFSQDAPKLWNNRKGPQGGDRAV